MAAWKTDNLIRVRNATKNTLVGAELAKAVGSDLIILPPLVDRDFYKLFDNEDRAYEKAVVC